MFNLSSTISVSFERGYMLVWTPDGIHAAETHAEGVEILTALGVAEHAAIDAMHAASADAAEYESAGF